MFYLKVYPVSGEVKDLPLGDNYEIVYVNSVDILQKKSSYKVMKSVRKQSRMSMTRTYLMSPNLIAPLDMEGMSFGVKVDKYEIYSETECLVTILPKRDFVSIYEAFDFWKCLEGILTN